MGPKFRQGPPKGLHLGAMWDPYKEINALLSVSKVIFLSKHLGEMDFCNMCYLGHFTTQNFRGLTWYHIWEECKMYFISIIPESTLLIN